MKTHFRNPGPTNFHCFDEGGKNLWPIKAGTVHPVTLLGAEIVQRLIDRGMIEECDGSEGDAPKVTKKATKKTTKKTTAKLAEEKTGGPKGDKQDETLTP